MTVYERFTDLLQNKGVRVADVTRATGIKSTVFSEWKKGKAQPKADKLQKIADYFGVSMEYLMTGKDWEWEAATPEEIEAFEKLTHPLPSTPIQSVPLTDQERELVGMIRDMNREGREKLLSLAKDLSQLYKKDGGQAQTA